MCIGGVIPTLSTSPSFTMFLPSTPVTNISIRYPHLPTAHPNFPCRILDPQLLLSYYLSSLGHFCPRSSSLMPVKPGSIPSPLLSAVTSHQSPFVAFLDLIGFPLGSCSMCWEVRSAPCVSLNQQHIVFLLLSPCKFSKRRK